MSKLNCSNCKYYDFKACDGVDWCELNHEETGICGYCDREFEDLEEATTHYDAIVEENNTFLMENSKMAGEIKDLQQQLAEKDAELEKWSTQYAKAYVNRQNALIAEKVELQNQKALEQLDKVKNYIITDEKDIFGANYLMKSGYVLDFIDNQINELKEMK